VQAPALGPDPGASCTRGSGRAAHTGS